jgi:predicted nucleic acid-binding protein
MRVVLRINVLLSALISPRGLSDAISSLKPSQ